MSTNSPDLPPVRRGHLHLATCYVRDAWFPVAQQTELNISELLKTEDSAQLREKIILEVKRDAAAASAVTNSLLVTSKEEVRGLGALRTLPQPRLKELFLKRSFPRSKHQFFELEPWQSARLKESAVSTVTAEVLSSSFEVDADLAHTCALVRQLGLSLLAWNYPHVFRRALTMIRPGTSLEAVLGKVLGFTPAMITSKMLSAAGAPPVILKVLADAHHDNSSKTEECPKITQLTSLCQIAEATSRATSETPHPSSKDDWELAKNSLEARIGTSGWRLLEANIKCRLATYGKLDSQEFSIPQSISTLSEAAVKAVGEGTLHLKNEYFEGCTFEIRQLLAEYYMRLQDPCATASALRHLLVNIAPRCGFIGGVIFQRSENSINSTPLIQFSSSSNTESSVVDRGFVVVRAVADAISMVHGAATIPGMRWIASTIKRLPESFFLYLEHLASLNSQDISHVTRNFNALSRAIADGLHLKCNQEY